MMDVFILYFGKLGFPSEDFKQVLTKYVNVLVTAWKEIFLALNKYTTVIPRARAIKQMRKKENIKRNNIIKRREKDLRVKGKE